MGIQRFGSHLKPYATKSILGSTASPAQNTIAIIDGPGLAHYIYYELCGKLASLKETITYAGIAAEVSAWLDTLASIGCHVHTIFFDGALPESKRTVRIERLQNYVARIRTYKETLRGELPRLTRAARRSLPPPPFLVFAVVEHLLRHHRYADTTFVVPGEADGFCVAAAHTVFEERPDETIAIFSDDADLLVYAVPATTYIFPFRDLTEVRTPTALAWRGERYWSTEIARGLLSTANSLIEPAFFMSKDPYLSLQKACQMTIASGPAGRDEYTTFARQFQPVEETKYWNEVINGHHLEMYFDFTDSRVSELINQLQETHGGIRMYLPLLLEDPERAPAWNAGAPFRQLAYSPILQCSACDNGIQEYRRSGARVVSSLVDTLTGTDLNERQSQLATHIEEVMAWTASNMHLNTEQTWRYIVMQFTMQYLQAERYPLPSVEDALILVAGRQGRSWKQLHLSAQYQAVYYSARMLQQILGYTLSKPRTEMPTTASLARLKAALDSFPQICEFFSETVDPNEDTNTLQWRAILGDALLALSEKSPLEAKGKRARKKTGKVKVASASVTHARNAFAILAED